MSNIRQPLYGEAAVQVRDQLAEDTRQHPADLDTAEPTRGPRETAETFDRAQVIAALPDAIDEAMRQALPHRYTPELASEVAETMAVILRQQQAGRPLTAAQRGQEWMNRWGCPGFCVQEHGKPEASDFHTTAPAESSLLAHEVDSSGYSENCEELPWLTAQVVVMNDKAQAYGRETRVFLSYGIHLAEVSPAKARQALDAMRGFVTRLSAVVDLAEQVAADDFEGDPEIRRLDTEAAERRIKARTAELLADKARA